MKRARRASFTSSATGAGSALAAAPSTGEAADAIEPRFAEKVEQFLELGLGLAGESDNEGAAQRDVGADLAPAADAREVVLGAGGALHELEDARARVLERDVEIGEDLALGHERHHFVHVRVGIDVVQPHP
jgi:hypothetical protein